MVERDGLAPHRADTDAPRREYDAVVIGGGPSGLAAALTLGRARRHVLLCDAGTPRNEAATHIHNFVTRDGTPPSEFRAIGRQQLSTYPNVDVVDAFVMGVSGTRGEFQVDLGESSVRSRRVLMCTGMIDQPLALEGFSELWGRSIFQCPYCHGWEQQDRRWGFLVRPGNSQMLVPFALQALGWTRDLVVFTSGEVEVTPSAISVLNQAGIRLETSPISRLVSRDGSLKAVELLGGEQVPCDVLLAHPPQTQVDLVQRLQLPLDDAGFVQVNEPLNETLVPGIYAAGDLTTRGQGAIWAAGAGARAASAINVDLAMERAHKASDSLP